MVDYVSTNSLSMLGGDDFGDIQQSIAELNASVVHKTGNLTESIDGIKIFTSDFAITNANTNIVSTAGINLASAVNYLNGTQNRIGSSLAISSTSIGNKIDCIGGYNLMTSSTTSSIANLIEATGGASNAMTTAGGGNNVLNAQGTGKNFLIAQTGNNEIQAGNANIMLIGTIEKLNMTSTTTTLTNPNINLNGALTITNNGAPTMRLNGDNISGLYFAFHPEGTSRRAYVGFPNGGVVNFVTSNEYTNGTISNIVNGSNKSLISTTGTVLTNGGHRIVSTGGDSEIEGTRIYNTFYTGGSFNVRFYNGSFSAAKCEINPTSTTLTNTNNSLVATSLNSITASAGGANYMGVTGGGATTIESDTGIITIRTGSTNINGINLINTANSGGITLSNTAPGGRIRLQTPNSGTIDLTSITNTITAATGGGNLMTVTGGDGGNVLRAVGTGTGAGGYNSIVGRNNYYDANPGGHFIRTGAQGSEATKISVYPTTTYMYNTNLLITMGDQFTVNCYINRIYCSAGGYHDLRVNDIDKMRITSATTDLYNGDIYINGASGCYTRVNSIYRTYHQTDRNEYRFNPTATNVFSQVWRLYDNGTTNVLYLLQGTSALNGVYLAAGANGWSGWSDERIKKNIKPIDTALTDILKLNPVFYNYKADDETLPERVGFIAQEVQEVYPDIINESKMDNGDIKNLLGIDMTNLVPYLVKAIQELNKKVQELSEVVASMPKG